MITGSSNCKAMSQGPAEAREHWMEVAKVPGTQRQLCLTALDQVLQPQVVPELFAILSFPVWLA